MQEGRGRLEKRRSAGWEGGKKKGKEEEEKGEKEEKERRVWMQLSGTHLAFTRP
jgi:hypothetical protein